MHLYLDEESGVLEISPEDRQEKEMLRGVVKQLKHHGFKKLRIETDDDRALDHEPISRRQGGQDQRTQMQRPFGYGPQAYMEIPVPQPDRYPQPYPDTYPDRSHDTFEISYERDGRGGRDGGRGGRGGSRNEGGGSGGQGGNQGGGSRSERGRDSEPDYQPQSTPNENPSDGRGRNR